MTPPPDSEGIAADDYRAEARALGIELPGGWAEPVPGEDGEGDEGLWPAHVPAATAWLAVQTQWRATAIGMGGLLWLGLDYAGARAGLEAAGIEVTPELWGEVTMIEAGAVEARNERAEQ